MLARLSDAMRADFERQLGWARAQAKRQAGHAILTLVLTAVASLAALGAGVVGLIAFYIWLAREHNQFVALGAIGGGLLLIALILVALVRARQRPRFASPPPLQLAQPAALLGISAPGFNSRLVGGEQVISLATATMRNGSRSAVLGTLAIVALTGLIVGRRLVARGKRRV